MRRPFILFQTFLLLSFNQSFVCSELFAKNKFFICNKDSTIAQELQVNILEEVELGGIKQWILARGLKSELPILLFLHGGPGFPEMPFTHIDSKELEKYFIVVNWDQRGTGKSYNENTAKESFNLEQFLSDTYELIQLLKKRFSKEKIFLLGHSWGSILGIITAWRYPKDIYVYIGMGQVVDMKEGEKISYSYTLNKAQESGDSSAVVSLKNIGVPPYKDWSGSINIQRQLLAKFGGSFRKISFREMGKYWNTSPYYTDADRNNFLKAFSQTQSLMWDELYKLNLSDSIIEFKVPVYFFTGRYDYQTPFELMERYFKIIKAPYKEIIWFENSGHFPNLDEPELYQEILINKILKHTAHK